MSLAIAIVSLVMWPISHWRVLRVHFVYQPYTLYGLGGDPGVGLIFNDGGMTLYRQGTRLGNIHVVSPARVGWIVRFDERPWAASWDARESWIYRWLGFNWDFAYSSWPRIWFHYFTAPCWAGVFAGLLWPALWAKGRFRPIRTGLCHACGYDLRGSPVCGACPECGQVPSATSSNRDVVDSKPASG